MGEAIGEEVELDIAIDPGDGTPPMRIDGEIDRIDMRASGGIEVIDPGMTTLRTDAHPQTSSGLPSAAAAKLSSR